MESFCQDVGVASVDDGQRRAPMIFPACCPEGDVVALIEHNLSLGQHRVVLDLGLPDSGAVVGQDDEFGFSGS